MDLVYLRLFKKDVFNVWSFPDPTDFA